MPANTPRLLNIPTAAEYSGISERYLRVLTSKGLIAVTKVGRRRFVTTEAIDAYIATNTTEPAEPSEPTSWVPASPPSPGESER